MMRFSCIKAVYKYTCYLNSRKKIMVTSQESQQPGKRNTLKKFHRSDPIR